MKKLFLTALLALPLNAMSEEVADTTVTYNGKQITISEDSVETHVSIYAPDGTRRATLQQGVNIVKLSNGRAVKIINK